MIHFTHKVHARARSLKLTVNSKGEVVVTTPRFTPQIIINRFVESHKGWIEEQQQKIIAIKKKANLKKDEVLYFGESYKVAVELDSTKPIGVSVSDQTIIVNPISKSEESVTKALNRFFKSQAQEYILQQVEFFGKKMNTTFNAVAFKQQKSRWGSCSSLGNLNFNWNLIHAPKPVIDYVIIHELAHRTHMDHSTNFWKLVEKFDPEYRIHRGWLKRKGMALG